jgi:hypothetical protein
MEHVKAVQVDLESKLATVEVEADNYIDAMNMLPTFVTTIKVSKGCWEDEHVVQVVNGCVRHSLHQQLGASSQSQCWLAHGVYTACCGTAGIAGSPYTQCTVQHNRPLVSPLLLLLAGSAAAVPQDLGFEAEPHIEYQA